MALELGSFKCVSDGPDDRDCATAAVTVATRPAATKVQLIRRFMLSSLNGKPSRPAHASEPLRFSSANVWLRERYGSVTGSVALEENTATNRSALSPLVREPYQS